MEVANGIAHGVANGRVTRMGESTVPGPRPRLSPPQGEGAVSAELVSILIPVYNRAGLIGESIRSALAQTYTALEVVVVDNASTDSTWEEVQALVAADSRVRAFRNEHNIGPVRNWMACAQLARGQFCKILWSDDLIEPDYLNDCMPYMQDPDVGFVYTAARIFRDGTPPQQAPISYDDLGTGVHRASLFIEGALLNGPFPYSPGCAVFRTADLQRNLWLDIPNAIGSDFSSHAIGNDFLVFLLTAKDYAKFATVERPLSLFRAHAHSISTRSGEGRVTLHYDIVRAGFAQQHVTDRQLLARLNAMLLLHRLCLAGGRYGLHRIQDFYAEPAFLNIELKSFLGGLMRILRRVLRVG